MSTEPTAPPAPDDATTRRALRRLLAGGVIGSLVEFYEFSVYAVLATTLAAVFFPSVDPTTALLSTLAVFAVAFFARPLGGFVWGAVGDRIGRKRTLALTVLLMSAATALMGVLPGYAAIGLAAPVLLVLLRFVQGVSAGGEISGAVSFVAEHAPENRRGFFVGMISVGAVVGTLLGSLIPGVLLLTLSTEQMQAWGWRIPLLVALPLGLIGLYIRQKLDETPYFLALREERNRAANPVRAALAGREQRRLLVIAFFLVAANASSFYMIVGYLPSFATRSLQLSGLQAFAPSVIALAACLVAEVGGAWLSERVGRRTVLLVSVVGLLVLSYPSFLLITSGTFGLIACGLVLFGLLAGAYAAVINAALVELFPTRVRVSGHGITYNLSVALFGGSAPYLLTWLGGVTGSTMVGAYYVMILAVVSLPAVLALRETARRPLPM
ncbi:MHS family proline/betaine transporter-like MFS transporter [Actinomycetospora succinea]|uniref:Putative proline/betaine transporter n=1 Tax=Actinomycetospora succinea TaxID=663603 RepID=A0A4R6UWL3_9PSEU|nr:MFS transporter [Actinomycetospora succinea]TDQ51808.1 MHS family proline/betaine transporter-like MFS transporter [Actinomycetospora succinea]